MLFPLFVYSKAKHTDSKAIVSIMQEHTAFTLNHEDGGTIYFRNVFPKAIQQYVTTQDTRAYGYSPVRTTSNLEWSHWINTGVTGGLLQTRCWIYRLADRLSASPSSWWQKT